jgi:hypothetical protein
MRIFICPVTDKYISYPLDKITAKVMQRLPHRLKKKEIVEIAIDHLKSLDPPRPLLFCSYFINLPSFLLPTGHYSQNRLNDNLSV